MGYRVKGTLKLPDGGSAQGLKVEFTAGATSQTVLAGTKYTMAIGVDGVYDINLEFGSYSVLGYVDGAYPLSMGSVVVDATTATGQTLTQLLGGTSDVPAEWVAQIEMWLAQSKAEADRATAQANRAQSEADRASQISGLDTVADAIGLAAIPLPDVWCPLSDSLRMITGYGREVKVGDDVVARMVNFTRSTTATYIGKDGTLKTAAANEPRFEKDGLLIEGQSTNLLPTSAFQSSLNGWTSAGGGAGNVYTYGNIAPNGANEALKASFALDGLDRTLSGVVQVGTTYTFSFWAKNETATPVLLGIRINGGVSASTVTVPANTGWARYAVTQTAVAGDAILRLYTQTKNTEFYLWGMQLEALQFASSYIPTNGAAVTRSADICTIPNPLNVPIDAGDMTVAIEVRRNPKIPPSLGSRIFQISGSTWLVADSTRFVWRGGTAEQWLLAKAASGSNEVVGYRINGARVTLRCGVDVLTGTRSGTIEANSAVFNIGAEPSGISNMFGHIRNLRIWHRALTDEQIKAIA